jgi:hypothetical protein
MVTFVFGYSMSKVRVVDSDIHYFFTVLYFFIMRTGKTFMRTGKTFIADCRLRM